MATVARNTAALEAIVARDSEAMVVPVRDATLDLAQAMAAQLKAMDLEEITAHYKGA